MSDYTPSPVDSSQQNPELEHAIQEKPEKKTLSPLLWLFVGLSLAAIAISTYSLFYQDQIFHQQLEKSDHFKARLNQQNQKLSNRLTELESQNQTLQNAQVDLTKQFTTLQAQPINQTASPERWKLYEIEYLINLAYWKLTLTHDNKTASALLSTAEQQVQTLNHPELLALRKTLIEDLAALSRIAEVDQEGLFLRLNQILQSIYNLPLQNQPTTLNTPSLPKDKINTTRSEWNIVWQDLKRDLKEMVHIRRHDKPFEPLLSELQQTQFLQTAQLLIQQAQLAIWSHDTLRYQQSLGHLTHLLERFFNPNNAETRSILTQIHQLMATTVAPSLPETLHSLTAIREALQKGIES